AADNSLPGTVSSIEPGNEHSEVIVTLAGGASLCSTQNNIELLKLNLRVGSQVIAQFNADRVIIATLC
ncbi:TOBE domain-containing protein, partial [Yersinia enterocolitica]